MLEMFGLNCFRVRTKSLVIAILKYGIKGAQLVVCLLVYVSHAYFYVIRSVRSLLHCFFTYLFVIKKIYKFRAKHNFIM
jgi:hypothetical protein